MNDLTPLRKNRANTQAVQAKKTYSKSGYITTVEKIGTNQARVHPVTKSAPGCEQVSQSLPHFGKR